MPRGKSPDPLQAIVVRLIARKIDIWCPNPPDFSENEKSSRRSKSWSRYGMEHDLEGTANPPLCEMEWVRPIVSPEVARLPGPYTRPLGFSSQPVRLPVILPITSNPSQNMAKGEGTTDCGEDKDDEKEMYEAKLKRSYELFEFLSTQKIQELLDALITRCQLAFHHLRVLVHPRLTCLSLVHTPYFMNDDGIIDIIADRCQNLTRLSLNLPKCESPDKLMALIAANPNLVFLNLSLTNTCYDTVLETVAKHCPKIREISVSSCPVTDAGIAHLTRIGQSGEPACRELVTLDLRRTTISAMGVKMALETLENVQNVYHMDVITALCTLHDTSSNSNKTHKLKTLESFFGRPPSNLSMAISHCPLITDINLYECTQSETLAPLCDLQHLRKLALKTSRNCFPLERMDFQSKVLPVLQSLGEQLENIQLVSFEDVDLAAILFLCKNLQTLIIDISRILLDDPFQNETEYCERLKQKNLNFVPLKYIETLNIITGMNCAHIPMECLKAMLTNGQGLTNLILDGIANLDSKTLVDILHKNPMRHLRKLEFCNLPLLTVDGIQHVLEGESPLEKLEVTQCNLLTHADREHLRKFLDTMHYSLAFTMIVSNWT
ncbi:uncharacterized protein LOC135490787 [Lineus longissimus]|uniref:uncharacterized protein LOC135490787 n=1 Tax=Lineus longissimus TaxID=88925 RepID=UPI00315DD6C4